MEEFISVHSSEIEPRRLRQLLADQAEREQALELRRYFLTRLAIIGSAVWLLAWPVHLLPHTVLWVFLAIVALLIGLTSTSRTHAPTRDTTPTPRH
jgi:hypothetical protein